MLREGLSRSILAGAGPAYFKQGDGWIVIGRVDVAEDVQRMPSGRVRRLLRLFVDEYFHFVMFFHDGFSPLQLILIIGEQNTNIKSSERLAQAPLWGQRSFRVDRGKRIPLSPRTPAEPRDCLSKPDLHMSADTSFR